jgi:uncharacterized protein (TIGR03382 family)
MRTLLSSAVVVLCSLGMWNAPAHAQSCTANDPQTCTIDDELQFCNSSNMLQVFDCSTAATGASCATIPCTGVDCPADAVTCVAASSGACIGMGALFNNDPDDDDRLGLVPCRDNQACNVDLDTGMESCISAPAGVDCDNQVEGSLRCEGRFMVGCQPVTDGDAFATPYVLDCRGLGPTATCVTEGEGVRCDVPCSDASDCPADLPVCASGSCDAGCTSSADCAAGQVCSQSMCIDDEPPAGCTNNSQCPGIAICVVGDCVNVECEQDANCVGDDVCVDNTCVAGVPGGEGEGEGGGNTNDCQDDGDCRVNEDCVAGTCEPRGSLDDCTRDRDCTDDEICEDDLCIEAECSRDNDCDDDEECDGGRCERVREEEEPTPEPALFTCGSGFTAPWPLLALGALLRRRRR